MPVPGLLLAAPALLGLALGSYAATAGLRLAEGAPTSRGRSRCDGCGAGLSFAATAPLISYVVLRGRCGRCRAAIHPAHPVGELLGAGVCVAAAAALPMAEALAVAAAGLLLISASVTDLRVRRLPNVLTLGVAVLGGLLAWLRGPSALLEGAVAAALVGGLLLGLRALGARVRGDPGLGLGDVKLIAALALWTGSAVSVAVALAALLGLLAAPFLRDGRGRLPFGPMIALAGWATGFAVQLRWTPWLP